MHPTLHPNFIQFLKEFNRTFDYFECHELLEEHWKEIAPGNKEHPLAVLVLLSTSMYHWRRGNFAGARKTMTSFIERIQKITLTPFDQYIDFSQLVQKAQHSLSAIERQETFQHFLIPIQDKELEQFIVQEKLTPLDIEYLTHKHMLRDRSEILAEREKQKKRRRG